MVRICALLLVIGCSSKKEPQPGPASGSSTPVVATDAAVAVAVADAVVPIDAPSGPIELLHSYGGDVTVSSHVMNKTIKPEHLVDRDFNTAWNSQTGQLAGAWIEVWSELYTKIEEVRLTVGHTGKGPKGEDYFTMNPRITKVSVSANDKTTVVALDPNVRELQSIKIDPPYHRVRIKVEEVVFGTKTNWREVCVSEIEAWGTPAPNAKPKPGNPTVSVDHEDLPKNARIEPGKPVDVVARCEASLKPMMKDFKARGGANLEDPGPDCQAVENEEKLGTPPWTSVFRWRLSSNAAHGPMYCTLFASTDLGTFPLGEERMCGPWDGEDNRIESATVEDVIPGGQPELVVKFATERDDQSPIQLMICRIAFDAVQCTKPFAIETSQYKVAPRFSKGTVVFDPVEGKAPTELSGPQSLNFDH